MDQKKHFLKHPALIYIFLIYFSDIYSNKYFSEQVMVKIHFSKLQELVCIHQPCWECPSLGHQHGSQKRDTRNSAVY